MDENEILNTLTKGISVVIVGLSDAGKTYWIQNTLIPHLKNESRSVQYSKDGFNKIDMSDIAIFDEAETLFDSDKLREKYPEDNPYYSEKYLRQVSDWHTLYASHKEPSLYIISRKVSDDVQYLVDHFHTADWDSRELRVFYFS